MDDLDAAEQPRCPACGTVMRAVDGAFACGWCGEAIEIPWAERPADGDDLPGLHG